MTLTARFLTNDDYNSFDEFLKPYTSEAFFLRSNARRAGLIWAGEAFEGQYIGVFDASGAFRAVIAYTWLNTITAHARGTEHLAPAIPLLKSCIDERGGKIEAVCAMKPEGDYISHALGLPAEASRRDDVEYLFKLNFADITSGISFPDQFHVRLAETSDFETLCRWRVDFNVEALNATRNDDLIHTVEAEIGPKIARHELYVLALNERPEHIVSFLGISGSIPEHAHIGPVYTPLEYRGNGYATALMAGALHAVNAARGNVVKTSGLFTANPDAVKVYEAIGYREAGHFRLNLLREDFRYTSSVL